METSASTPSYSSFSVKYKSSKIISLVNMVHMRASQLFDRYISFHYMISRAPVKFAQDWASIT